TNSTATLLLDKGPHEITLFLDDHFPYGTNSRSALIEVIAPSQATGLLLALIDNANVESRDLQPLTATLESAIAAFDKGHDLPAVNILGAFQNQTRAMIGPIDPGLADQIARAAQLIIDAVHARSP